MRAPINPMPIETYRIERKMVSKESAAKERGGRAERLTTGLNKPPLMRKKVHAVTTKANAAPNAMYSSSCGVTEVTSVSMLPFLVLLEEMKAT